MRTALVAVLLGLLVACGGGGGPSGGGPIAPAPALRSDLLLFGYYYANSSTVNETAGHVNLHWAAFDDGGGFISPAGQMAGLIQAKANGQRVVLMLPTYSVPLEQREAEVRFWLQRLKNAGLLWPGIVALYPQDEPDVAGLSDAEVTATNAAVRRAMAGFHELGGARLAVIYACSTERRPGLASYDWIGCDHYEAGCRVLTAWLPGLLEAMLATGRTDQRLMVIAGGADPWRQDPACFERYAHAEPIVVALIGFLWQSIPGHVGIRDNGMRRLYCEAGAKIVTGKPLAAGAC